MKRCRLMWWWKLEIVIVFVPFLAKSSHSLVKRLSLRGQPVPRAANTLLRASSNAASFQKMGSSRTYIAFFLLLISSTIPSILGQASRELHFKSMSPFPTALETLQKQIGYTFKSINLLRRAMTHASFSEENNKALSILGSSIIETKVSLQLLSMDIDVSVKELTGRISQVSNEESLCSVDGMRLGLHKVVRVSAETNAAAPSVVCGAFRAIMGAIAVDSGNTDAAGNVFQIVHGRELRGALAMFIYVFIGIVVIIGVILFGSIFSTHSLSVFITCACVKLKGIVVSFLKPTKYAALVVLLIWVGLGWAAFIFFDKSRNEEIPTDTHGFLRESWNIMKWFPHGLVIFEILRFLLALIVRAASWLVDYDSDEEYINARRKARQPLLEFRTASRDDAWSTRMREKYGLDTAQFTYNPSESHRFQQPNSQPTKKKSRCTIM